MDEREYRRPTPCTAPCAGGSLCLGPGPGETRLSPRPRALPGGARTMSARPAVASAPVPPVSPFALGWSLRPAPPAASSPTSPPGPSASPAMTFGFLPRAAQTIGRSTVSLRSTPPRLSARTPVPAAPGSPRTLRSASGYSVPRPPSPFGSQEGRAGTGPLFFTQNARSNKKQYRIPAGDGLVALTKDLPLVAPLFRT